MNQQEEIKVAQEEERAEKHRARIKENLDFIQEQKEQLHKNAVEKTIKTYTLQQQLQLRKPPKS